MTDPPRRPPRPEVFPPPLPPRPLVSEPFPKAKSDPPRVLTDDGLKQLSDTPPPDARRMRSTPPEGMPLPQRGVEASSSGPLEDIIREQRIIIAHQREKITEFNAQARERTSSPVPSPPRSRALVAGKVGLNLGKYTTLAIGALGLVDVAVGLWFPEYVGPMKVLKNLVGIP